MSYPRALTTAERTRLKEIIVSRFDFLTVEAKQNLLYDAGLDDLVAQITNWDGAEGDFASQLIRIVERESSKNYPAISMLLTDISNKLKIRFPDDASFINQLIADFEKQNEEKPEFRKGRYLLPIVATVLIVSFIATIIYAIPKLPHATQVIENITLTPLFPEDPTSTPIVTSTNTPIPSPSFTPIPTNTLTPLVLASTEVAINRDWKPILQERENGVQVALVPTGCFMMGSENGESNEMPVVQKCITKPYWIDVTEVNDLQYGSAGYWGQRGDKRARDGVTWFEARDYCRRIGGRLPSEIEWEFAARGPSNLVYPWGTSFFGNNLVYIDNSDQPALAATLVPGNINGSSWVGAHDMSGNLWEWTGTIYAFYTLSHDVLPDNYSNQTALRVLRGGSWRSEYNETTATYRKAQQPSYNSDSTSLPKDVRSLSDIGFRCVYPVE